MSPAPRRLRDLPSARVAGHRVPVALTWRSRLLGLALLRRGRAGPGLLIPRCSAVHSFGMRFALTLVFLDGEGSVIERRPLEPWRLAVRRGAAAVLELPGPTVPAAPIESGRDAPPDPIRRIDARRDRDRDRARARGGGLRR